MGREAVERALQLCRAWGGSNSEASAERAWQMAQRATAAGEPAPSAVWLDDTLSCATVPELEAMLEQMAGES